MLIVFWSIVLVVVIAGLVWTRVRRRRIIAAIEASSLVPDGKATAGRSRSSYEIESRAHMGAGQAMFGAGPNG